MHVQRLLFAKCFIFSRLLLSLCVSLLFCFVCVVPFSVVSALVGRSPFSALLFDFASLSLIIVYSMSFSVFLRFLSVYFTLQCCFGSADLHLLSVLRGFAVKILGSEQQLLRQL